mmetsp:Transcript_8255/g.14971  ORF Transcript_8255/g.14971 Transcript_8255/m.14971 type:complete len:88 (-) Transcript_8255:247-510(-)
MYVHVIVCCEILTNDEQPWAKKNKTMEAVIETITKIGLLMMTICTTPIYLCKLGVFGGFASGSMHCGRRKLQYIKNSWGDGHQVECE